MDERKWCVIVRFGNMTQLQKYVSGCTAKDAETHKAGAIKGGYRDATIWDEEEWNEKQKETARSKAASRRSYSAA